MMDGSDRTIFLELCSHWHYSYGFNNYVLCHWCYETLVLFERTIPIDLLVSDKYVKEWEEIDMFEEKPWTRTEFIH